MKTFIKYSIFAFIGAMTLTACNDWLDVSPKSQILEDKQYSREGGYEDQLTGIYTAMSQQSMYGLNMGIGFTEVLSHSYDVDGSGNWAAAAKYDYTDSRVESTISSIWKSTYNCIANCNSLIGNIDKADSASFTDNNYHVYRGEAYGLRAFLHLDLMRLFACAPAMDNNAKGVPYVTQYSTSVAQQQTVGETMQLIVNDLLTARQELSHDPLKISDRPYYSRSQRIPYFNYYAATLSLARAYLWMGDKQHALKYAQEIVDTVNSNYYSLPFNWIHYTNMQQSSLNTLDMAFSCEHIFHLTIKNWEDTGNFYFTSKGGSSALTPNETTAQDIYEVAKGYGNDYRYLKGYEQDGENRYMCKFWHVEGGTYNDIYPLLRMTEAFYIAAECLKDTKPAEAVKLLNEVRENRNLSLFPLSDSLTPDEIQQEIYKEYRKEFVGEGGQLFFYYKRLNLSDIKGSSGKGSRGVYVLPIPQNDQEFGGYSN